MLFTVESMVVRECGFRAFMLNQSGGKEVENVFQSSVVFPRLHRNMLRAVHILLSLTTVEKP